MLVKLTILKKFSNYLTKNGNKQTSEKLLLNSFKIIQKVQKTKNFKEILKLALVNSSPVIYIKKIKRRKKLALEFPFILKDTLKKSPKKYKE